MAQPIFRLRLIGDYHAIAAKMRDLLLICQGWFSVSAGHKLAFSSNMKHLKKDPPSVHILTDRGLAGAIDYYVRDQILHFNEQSANWSEKLVTLDFSQTISFFYSHPSILWKSVIKLRDVFRLRDHDVHNEINKTKEVVSN